MAFKEVTDLSTDTTVALGGVNRKTGKKNPTSVEGYYLGSRKVESKKAKTGFAYIHIFQTAKGNVGVWGKTDLDRKILTATPGTMLRASHVGMVQTPNGEMYKYKVEVDADNTIEVSNQAPGGFESEDGDDMSYLNDSSSSDEDSEDEEQDSEALEAEASRIAANKARVQALLSKNKKA